MQKRHWTKRRIGVVSLIPLLAIGIFIFTSCNGNNKKGEKKLAATPITILQKDLDKKWAKMGLTDPTKADHIVTMVVIAKYDGVSKMKITVEGFDANDQPVNNSSFDIFDDVCQPPNGATPAKNYVSFDLAPMKVFDPAASGAVTKFDNIVLTPVIYTGDPTIMNIEADVVDGNIILGNFVGLPCPPCPLCRPPCAQDTLPLPPDTIRQMKMKNSR